MDSEREKKEEPTQGCVIELATAASNGPLNLGRSPLKWVSDDRGNPHEHRTPLHSWVWQYFSLPVDAAGCPSEMSETLQGRKQECTHEDRCRPVLPEWSWTVAHRAGWWGSDWSEGYDGRVFKVEASDTLVGKTDAVATPTFPARGS